MTVRQGLIALAVGAVGVCLNSFTLLYLFSPLSPSLWETARYRLKFYLKGPFNFKQPTKRESIGVGRVRTLGGQSLEYWGGGKGGKFPPGT